MKALGSNWPCAPEVAFLVYRRVVQGGSLPDTDTFPVVLKSCANACRMFDEMLVRDVVSWIGLISGYVSLGLFDVALVLFKRMDVDSNVATNVSVLVACGRLGNVSMGKGVHGLMGLRGFDVGLVVGNALIDLYVKCDLLSEAKRAFYELPNKDIIEGIESDRVILTGVLSACGSLAALDYGNWVHEYIKYWGIKWDVRIGTALGYGNEALKHLEIMIEDRVKPSEVTFLAIPTACCHYGLVNEGRHYFNIMISQNYNLSQMLDHYGCTADLLCRAGHLDQAQELIEQMPMPPDILMWGALLGACRASGNVMLSKKILDHLLELGSRNIRRLMKNQGVIKVPGSNVIEVDGKGPEILAGDFSHPQNEEIHRLLSLLTDELYVSLDVPIYYTQPCCRSLVLKLAQEPSSFWMEVAAHKSGAVICN
ncbi:Pentatricopeptide repeat [Dillenia turbinata]|uniref:Pentatricopeptide repeat n=1 Tax=Dillenia turbinata TaxID=194707 RepID=A0AAN8V449_9MAGN